MQDSHTEIHCCCEHHRSRIKPKIKWSFSLVFILTAIFLIKPFLVNQIVSRAEAYTTYGLYEDAVRQYHKVLFIDSKNSNMWNSLGDSYKSLGALSDATFAYHTAIEIDTKNDAALFNLGMISMLKRDYQNAMPYFERVVRLGPEDAKKLAVSRFSQHESSMEMLALCYQRLGQTEEAKRLLEELLRIYPNCISAQKKLLQFNERESQ